MGNLENDSFMKPHPTMRAADGGESARFIGIFLASSFFLLPNVSLRPPLVRR
jgi:hypothetical protein